MFCVAPRGGMLRVHRTGDRFKSRGVADSAPLRWRSPSGSRVRPLLSSGLPSVGERDYVGAPKPDISPPAVDCQPEYPRGRATGSDEKMQASAIEIPPRHSLADERSDFLRIQ